MTKVLLQPASGPEATEHYNLTIEPGVALYSLRPYLRDIEQQKIVAVMRERVRTWGIIPTIAGGMPKTWQDLREDDYTVFYKKGRLYFVGKILSKVHNQALALALWGANQDGRTWEYIYFLKEGKQIDVPFNPLVLGYKHNYIPQGSILLKQDQSESLLGYLVGNEIDLSDEDQIYPNSLEEERFQRAYSPPLDEDEALRKIKLIAGQIGSIAVKERVKLAKYLSRNPTYSRLVKERAHYVCELCGASPFIQKNGMPFAEAHHLDELAVARIDNPLRMICVCPTCHRIIHFGNEDSIQSRLGLKTKH
ncbi:hypothetical protein ACFLTL_00645 [Chloroflexota bacterium]